MPCMQCTVGASDRMEILPFAKATCTALTTAVSAVQVDCERVYRRSLPCNRKRRIRSLVALQLRHVNVKTFQITGNSDVCSTACPCLQQREIETPRFWLALCERSIGAHGFPSQRVSNTEPVSMSWSHHMIVQDDNVLSSRTVEIWERISGFIPHFITDVITYPCRG